MVVGVMCTCVETKMMMEMNNCGNVVWGEKMR